RLDAVEDLGDQVLAEAGQDDPAGPVGQAGRRGPPEDRQLRAAGCAPGHLVCRAQPAPGVGREALAGIDPAAPDRLARRRGRVAVVTVHEGRHALAATPPEPVAARAQVVRGNRALEARQAADQAQAVAWAVPPPGPLVAERLQAGPPP